MSISRVAGCAVVALALGVLWFYEVRIWHDRTRRIFRSDPSAVWEKVFLATDIDLTDEGLSTEDMQLDKVPTDWYSQALLHAAADPRSSCTTVVCDIASLDRACKENREWLYRYLACNPGWCFHRWNGRLEASRRVQKGEQWHLQNWSVHFDNTHYDETLDDFVGNEDQVESACTILFEKVQYYGPQCKSGERVPLELKPISDDCSLQDSYFNYRVVCEGDSLLLQVDEIRTFMTSRVTQVAFDLTEKEFARVSGVTNWTMLKATLPEGAVCRGAERLDIVRQKDGCGHAYQAWVNPGGPGETYLKAFELTQDHEIVLREKTLEYVGWSNDPDEKFFIGNEIDIRGDKKSYAARIEVWFIPAGGGPERKLVERVFRVKGKEQ